MGKQRKRIFKKKKNLKNAVFILTASQGVVRIIKIKEIKKEYLIKNDRNIKNKNSINI